VVKIICKICGIEWDDKRHDMLTEMSISSAPRTCCDECVEEVFKKDYNYLPEEIKRIVEEKRALSKAL